MAATAGRGRELYQPFDAFVVRAPLLPVGRYLALAGAADGDPARDGVVRLALLAGSPTLADALARERPGRGRDLAARSSLLRYLIRMSTRPTPYGLFAGAALGTWSDRTDLALAAVPRRTRTRPDMGWLLRLVLSLEAEPRVRRGLRLLANACAAERGGRVTLADRATGGRGPGPDVSVRATPVVRRVLRLARRPVAYDALVSAVAGATPAATAERVAGLLDELWRQDLLLSDLRPPPFGDPARYVAERLARVEPARAVAEQLASVLAEAAAVDRLDADEAAAALAQLRKQLRAISVDDDPEAEVVQVDSALVLAGERLSSEVAREAARGMELLLRLHPAPGGPGYLAAYRAAFEARYGHERWVPLLELLDPRSGLGLPWAHAHAHHPAAGRSRAAARDELLLELATEALRDGRQEVELDDALVAALTTWEPERTALPPSLELSAFVLARSPEALDRGEFRLLVGPNLGAPAAGRGLGRFADLLGAPAARLLRQVALAEDAAEPGRIVAELAFMPLRARAANVTVRPQVHGYEIPIGIPPSLPDDRVVRPDELAVGVRGGRLRLWWVPRGVEVVVTSGHMLNPHRAPDLCRFLQEVGHDGVTSPTGFDWGTAEGLAFLPRVRAGRLVLRPARWRQPLGLALQRLTPEDQRGFAAALARWRRRWRLPRHVYLAAGDNRLLLDLDDPAQAAQVREHLRRRRGSDLVLEEALPGPDDAWLPGPGGGYAVEVVVPLLRRAPGSAAEQGRSSEDGRAGVTLLADADRRRAPGSDWLYLTLHGPHPDEDELLAGPIREFAASVVDAGQAEGWLFVRYADPDPHLRLRFHGPPSSLASEVLPRAAVWAAGLVAAGRRTRFGVEVYDRELERYGGTSATALAEALFCADSATAAELLRLLRGPGRLDRTDLAVLSIDDLLDSLGLDLGARSRWCAEDGPAAASREYRGRKERLRRLLAGADGTLGEAHAEVLDTLAVRRRTLARVATGLAALADAGELTQPLPSLLRSYAHLHCNRLLGPDHDRERLVLGLLRRTLRSLVAAPLPGATRGR